MVIKEFKNGPKGLVIEAFYVTDGMYGRTGYNLEIDLR